MQTNSRISSIDRSPADFEIGHGAGPRPAEAGGAARFRRPDRIRPPGVPITIAGSAGRDARVRPGSSPITQAQAQARSRSQARSSTRASASARRFAIAGALALAMVLAPTIPGDAHAAENEIDAWLEQLDHESFEVRERATGELIRDGSVRLSRLLEAYDRATTTEQRFRLREAIRHHVVAELVVERFPAEGPGSIGILPIGVPANDLAGLNRTAVRVATVFAGFPAYTVLERGDLILAVEGRSIPQAETREEVASAFASLIKERRAGERIMLTVIGRDGRRREVSLTLANLQALREMYLPDGRSLRPGFRDAWRAMRRRLADRTPEPPVIPIVTSAGIGGGSDGTGGSGRREESGPPEAPGESDEPDVSRSAP